MHNLENILLMAAAAVERGAITKAELVSTLRLLAGASGDYGIPPDGEPIDVIAINDTWSSRFGDLMIRSK